MEVKETVTGESTATSDGIVLALVEQLELITLAPPISEMLSGNAASKNIEVEARIGILRDRDDKRYILPIDGDALLSKRAQASFNPGVSENQLKTIDDILKKDESWIHRGTTQTIDRFFKLTHYQDQVRLSKSPTLETLECITKSKLVTLDVSTGKTFYQETDENIHNNNEFLSLDYRISINLETIVNTNELPNENMAVFQRYRTRDTFYHAKTGITIDLTKVTSRAGNKSGTSVGDSCEVEIELNSKKLLGLLKADTPDLVVAKRLKLIRYCATLVNAARSLCTIMSLDTHLGVNKSHLKIKISDLRIDRDSSEVERYKQLVNAQQPLIGDYLYRTLAAAGTTTTDLTDGISLYDNLKLNIQGPYRAKIDDHGKKIVVLESN